MQVRDVMSTELVTLTEDERLDVAETMMHLAEIRHLPVVRGEQLIGLVSHRDLLRAQAALISGAPEKHGDALRQPILAGDIMTTGIEVVTPSTEVLEAARLIQSRKLGCLPVVDSGRQLVGIITEADFVALVIARLEAAEGANDRSWGWG